MDSITDSVFLVCLWKNYTCSVTIKILLFKMSTRFDRDCFSGFVLMIKNETSVPFEVLNHLYWLMVIKMEMNLKD